MSTSAPAKPSGIKPPTSRLARPSVTSKPASNGSSGENMSRLSSESDAPKKKLDANLILTTDTDSFIIGQHIYVNGIKPGKIQFIGETKFAPGEWAGIVLDDLSGKNDGSVGGVRYFQCQPKKGVFSRLGRLTRQPLDAIQLAALQSQQSQPAASENGDESSSGTANTNGANGTSSTSPVTATPNSVVSVQSIGDLRLGDRVIVTSSQGSKAGILRYLGTAEFAVGQWAGVELDDPTGKNDGAVAGTRYFECQQHYGLFAPIHKVSRSPANHMRRTSGVMNTSMSSSLSQPRAGGMSRTGTRRDSESASVTSVATSRASTAISRKTSRPSVTGSAHNHQDLLRERDQHIEQLMKEREMERSEVTRAAAQADEAEHQLSVLQRQYNLEKEENVKKIEELEQLLLAAESVRSSQGAQIDDLQFRLEEETILRAEIEAQQKGMDDKEKEWARQVEQLESEAQRCFEAEELAARYKDELDALQGGKGQQQPQSSTPDQSDDERIRQLEASVQAKENELSQLKNSMQELSKSLESEQLKNRNAEERFQALESELQVNKTSQNEMKNSGETDLAEWKNKLEMLERQNADSQVQIEKLNEEKLRFETQFNEAQALLNRSQDTQVTESHELKAKLEEMTRQHAESQEQMSKLNEEKEQLESQLADSLSSSNQMKDVGDAELNKLKMKLDELERQLAKNEEQLFNLDEEKVRLELQLADTQTSAAQLEEAKRVEVEMKNQQLEELKNLIQGLERQREENKLELAKMEEEKFGLDVELQRVHALLDESKEIAKADADTNKFEFEELKAQYDALELQQTEIQIQLANIQEEKAKSEEDKVKLDAELQSVKALLTESTGAAITQVEETKNEFVELKIKYNELERQLAEVNIRLENTQKEKTRSEEEKIKLDVELKAVKDSLFESKEVAKSEAEKKNNEYEELKGKYETLERQETEVNVQLVNLQEEKAKVDEEKSKLEAELKTAHLSLAESLEAAKAEAEKKKLEFEGLKSEFEILGLQQSEIKVQLAHLQEEKTKSESALQKKCEDEAELWRKKCNDFEQQKAANDQRLTQLDEEKSRLESELLRLSSTSSNASQDLTRLHGELMAARQTLAESQSQTSKLELEKTGLQQLNATFQSDLQNRDEKIVELSSVKADLERQIQEINQTLKEAQTQFEKDKTEWNRLSEDLHVQLQNQVDKIATLAASQVDLQTQLQNVNETLAETKLQSQKDKSEWEQSNGALNIDLTNKEKHIADLLSAAATTTNKYESELKLTQQECDRMKEQLRALESHQQESVDGMAELQKSIAVLEVEKSDWLTEKLQLEESFSQLENQLSSLSNEKEESSRKIQERDEMLAKLTEEVKLLQEKFTIHIAELEQKLQENRTTAETEKELQIALAEARARADEIQGALEESQKNEKELLELRSQLALANKLHEEFNQQSQKEHTELKQRIDELSALKESMQDREVKLQEDMTLLKRQLDEQNNRLQGQLDVTKQEAESARQLLQDLEVAQNRIKELQSNLDETDQRLAELQEVELRVKSLEEKLELKTIELKEEMDDRDKAEERVLRLTECVAVKDKELEALRLETMSLKKSTTEVSHLLTAFSTVDREKKQLEAKVVELQVAAAAVSRGAGVDAADTDVRIKKLKDDYQQKEQEIKFLNSVIVDMQRKVEDLNVKLEISQATLLGQNALTPESNRNGVKIDAKPPRLFCDICDLFDLHDTEDCPTQASEDLNNSPPFSNQRQMPSFNQNSPSYKQHSHHGGMRGAMRPYCDNCEVFGHATSECAEDATF